MRMASKSDVNELRSWKEGLMYLHLFQSRRRGQGRDVDRLLLGLQELHVQTERLELADQHVERFRQARGKRRVPLHDGFVDLRAPRDVIRLRSEELLEDVRRAVRLERPHFHFSEPLSAELRLAAQRLLGD